MNRDIPHQSSAPDEDADSVGEDNTSEPGQAVTPELSASRRKLSHFDSTERLQEAESDNYEEEGYLFVDIKKLSSPISEIHV